MSKKNKFFLLLSAINVGTKTKRFSIKIAFCKSLIPFLLLLKKKGYIYGFKSIFNYFEIYLRFFKEKPLYTHIQGISSTSNKRFVKKNKIKPLGVYSTALGLFLGYDVLKKKIGGEFLCELI